MNPKPPEKHTQLLAETFHDEWNAGSPAAFARAAAQHARGRRWLRRAATIAAAGAALLAFGFILVQRGRMHLVPIPSPSAAAARGYEIISDDELLADLRDEPLLVVKKANGTREFVFLEAEPPGEPLE